MKKTLLAAALIAGFAGVAQAETSVTLYGIIDTGISYQRIKGNDSHARSRTDATNFKSTKTGMTTGIQSGSRWGLKGSEDLGNGLRAVFVLESGFDSSTGGQLQGGRLFGRQATIGVAGDSWGQLDLGRQTNIASKYLPGVADPFAASFGQANGGTSFTSANTVRYDNMVLYQTPNFSGFQFGVGYSFNTNGSQQFKVDSGNALTDGLQRNQRAITTGLRYANGPIGVALTYDQYKTAETRNAALQTSGGVNVKSWNLGGSYDFEVIKAYLAVGQTRNGLFAVESFANQTQNSVVGTGTNQDGMKVNSYLVGLSAPIGNGSLMASWQMADPRSNPNSWDGTDLESSKQQIYSMAYTYGLSKRTNVYAYGSYAKHANFLPDAKSTVVGVGVRHQF